MHAAMGALLPMAIQWCGAAGGTSTAAAEPDVSSGATAAPDMVASWLPVATQWRARPLQVPASASLAGVPVQIALRSEERSLAAATWHGTCGLVALALWSGIYPENSDSRPPPCAQITHQAHKWMHLPISALGAAGYCRQRPIR